MRKILFLFTTLIVFFVPAGIAQQEVNQTPPMAGAVFEPAARDWHDFHKFHEHVEEAIHEVEVARKANHYDTVGHGRKTDFFLRLAEIELRMANDSTNSNQLGNLR
jgi:hypothetical protein